MTPLSSAAWQPRDCHAHTTWSDGELDPPSMIAAVRARGVRPTISDHVTVNEGYGLSSSVAVAAYLDALEALDDPDLAIAGEFCWHASIWRALPPAVVRRFTHRLGSLHAIELPDGTLQNLFHGDLPPGLTPDAYMEIHVGTLERFAAEMPVDILAHPTLLPVPLQGLPIEELWTEPRETRAVNALRRAGIAFEISNRYRAHQRFVRRAYESGARLSLGSDGHTRQAVGDIAWPLAVARAVGARDDELYDPFRHGSRTGAHPERAPRPPSVSAPERQPAPG
jgi:histidinol phosphatase-like PHP family hydrolase